MIKVTALNHACLVVSDRKRSEEIFMGVLGLERHGSVESWYWIDGNTTLHLVEIGDEALESCVAKEIQHIALQVSSLSEALSVLLEAGLSVFQMNFQGETRDLTSAAAPLDFGLGTLFFNDFDGNLIELIEPGRGVFTEAMMYR